MVAPHPVRQVLTLQDSRITTLRVREVLKQSKNDDDIAKLLCINLDKLCEHTLLCTVLVIYMEYRAVTVIVGTQLSQCHHIFGPFPLFDSYLSWFVVL